MKGVVKGLKVSYHSSGIRRGDWQKEKRVGGAQRVRVARGEKGKQGTASVCVSYVHSDYFTVPLRVLVDSESTSRVGRSVGSVSIFIEGNWSKIRSWFLFVRFLILSNTLYKYQCVLFQS
jgi:hypothetical protein